MVSARQTSAFFALAYLLALAFQLDRATQTGEFVPSRTRVEVSDETRALLALPPCWWTATADDLARIRGLGDRDARLAVRARDAGAAPVRSQLVAHGLSARKAAIISTGVAVACDGPTPGVRAR